MTSGGIEADSWLNDNISGGNRIFNIGFYSFWNFVALFWNLEFV
jgi:hypothetical protein